MSELLPADYLAYPGNKIEYLFLALKALKSLSPPLSRKVNDICLEKWVIHP
jgi:hypothetical protein